MSVIRKYWKLIQRLYAKLVTYYKLTLFETHLPCIGSAMIFVGAGEKN